ncbi:MAG: tetratricopeptide repeat protein [Myxococcales bacterium]|nr:tetratricopeptide repeat protein [Myxococcales bacterium]
MDEEGESTKKVRPKAAHPENLESSIYLRERTDTLGQAARDYQNANLEKMLRERENLVRVRRKSAVLLLEEFIRVEPESAAEMPDALLRLAELRWETARDVYLRAFAEWQRGPRGARGPEPKPDYRACIALYDRLLEKHKKFERYDLVLYMKAFALLELNDTDGALALYGRLRTEFPKSRFVPDAHMAFAEAAFTGSYDYATALSEYEKVLEYPDSGLFDIALFKSAWCLWKLGRTKDAATRFRRVLDLGNERANLSSDQRRRLEELQTEALDYLIQVFTEDERNTAADVFGFLEEIGGEKYAYRVLVRLSDTYVGQARYDRAVQAYRLLLEMDPASPEAPNYQHEIAESYASLEDDPNTVKALTDLAAKYRKGSPWAVAQSDPEVVAAAAKMAERTVRRRAMRWHELGQREKQRTKFERAVELYGVYLEYFGSDPHAYEVEFYRAEVLFHRLDRYPEAGAAYLSAARRNPKGEYTRDAL